MKRPILVLACVAVAAAQQTQDTNPGRSPDVFLDNHRPLIKKKDRAPTSRMVSGHVVDDAGTPLEGALVTLTDSKTKEKRTFFTKKGGNYNFEELSFTNDYTLQARWKALSSDERKLSQYDRAARIVRILQIATPEGVQPPAAEAKKEDLKPK
jgi:hypothetical protein